jgi:hypothetical protein
MLFKNACFKCFLDGFFSFINQLGVISKHVYLCLDIRSISIW